MRSTRNLPKGAVGVGRELALLLVSVVAWAGVAAAPAGARVEGQEGSERSGVILGGFAVMAGDGTNLRCIQAPDCLAWHAAGCPGEVSALPEPSLITAFVDVADLAGSPVSTSLSLNEGAGWWFGGVTVQFWDEQCNNLDRNDDSLLIRIDVNETERFRIPNRARWMTLVSFDVANVRWTVASDRRQGR